MTPLARFVKECHWIVLLAVAGISPTPLRAAENGSAVVVLYNARVAASKEVADYYARRREVPTNQVFGLDLPTTEAMTRAEFREQLQKPLLQRLEAAKLITVRPDGRGQRVWTHATFRYLALCYGVPTKVHRDPGLIEPGTEQLRPELKRNEASVDSELAALPLAEGQFRWTGPWPNPHYGATNASQLHPTNGLLLVARLDGPTAAVARGLVDKALVAETNGLWGRAYFDAGHGRNDTNYALGDRMIRGAAEVCRALGFETELDENPGTLPAAQPLSQIALYAGWYAPHVNGPFGPTNVEFMPGAFAYHLHSFSAATLRTANSHWVGPLLARGAACSMGSVDEPYLGATPDIATFLPRFLHSGFSFGEAAWAAQNMLSWQNLAVGDPLYRPFARRPDLVHAELEKQQSPLREWSHLKIINMNLARGADLADGIAYLEQLPLTRQSAVLKEKLAELYWAKRKLGDALDTAEDALKLNPSPGQRLRLLLNLGERRMAYGPDQRAFDHYQQILKDYPDYPDPLLIYQRLLTLARRLENKEAIERYEREVKRLTPPPAAPAKS
jgi:uncharacterized protein (TIGR03790 family)